MNIYCQNCGQLHKYTAQKPNFCMKCGTGMSSVAKAPVQEVEQGLEIEVEEDIPQNKQELFESIQKLDFESAASRRTAKLGSLAGTYSEQDRALAKANDPMPKAKRVNKKAFMEAFKKEAGSLRGKGPENA